MPEKRGIHAEVPGLAQAVGRGGRTAAHACAGGCSGPRRCVEGGWQPPARRVFEHSLDGCRGQKEGTLPPPTAATACARLRVTHGSGEHQQVSWDVEGDPNFVIAGGVSVPGLCRRIPALVLCTAGSTDACWDDVLPGSGRDGAGVLWYSPLGWGTSIAGAAMITVETHPGGDLALTTS